MTPRERTPQDLVDHRGLRRLLLLVLLLLVLLAGTTVAAGKTNEEIYKEKAAKLKPDDVAGHYRLAKWCKAKGLAEQARAHFEKVVALDPDHRGSRRDLGYEKYGGRWVLPHEKARLKFEERLAALDDADEEAHYDLGLWCLKRGLFEEATREFERVLELDPEHTKAKRKLESAATSVLEKRVAAYLASDDKGERAKLLDAIRQKDRIAADEVKQWIYFVKGRLQQRPKHDGKEVTKLHHPKYPAKYRLLRKTRGKDLSLLVLLHSGGPTTPAMPVNERTWEGLTRYRNAPFDLIAIPRVWDDTTGAGWVRESGPVAVRAMIDEIKRTYPVDTDRIYLWGYSMGGYGTCWIGSLEADLFAAAGIFAAGHSSGGAQPANLLHVPLTLHIGDQDHASDHIGTARKLRSALDALRAGFPGGYRLDYHEYPATGHQLPMAPREESFRWMKGFKRDPLPRTVVWRPFSPSRYPTHKQYFYWLHLREPRDGMRIHAQVTGDNEITVKTDRVKSFTVFLNDRLVDLKSPVTLSVNGRRVHRGVPVPSLSAIVESLDAKEDDKQVFTARIDVR